MKRKSEEKYTVNVCDYNGHQAKNVKRLDTGGGSGVFLCRTHWNKEMKWRKERNKSLAKENKFEIISWSKAPRGY